MNSKRDLVSLAAEFVIDNCDSSSGYFEVLQVVRGSPNQYVSVIDRKRFWKLQGEISTYADPLA